MSRRDPTAPHPRTERGLDRLVNFTDATVAIAITVLVLPLVDLAGEIHDERLVDVLSENRGAVTGFAVTFLVIARLWVAHHRIFESVADYDTGLVWWSFAWLFSIVALPFAANILSSVDEETDPAIFGLYIGSILLATLTIVGTERHLQRRPQLLRPDGPGIDPTLAIIMSALVAVALVVAVAIPEINLWALLLLLLTAPIDHLIERRRGGGSTAPDPG